MLKEVASELIKKWAFSLIAHVGILAIAIWALSTSNINLMFGMYIGTLIMLLMLYIHTALDAVAIKSQKEIIGLLESAEADSENAVMELLENLEDIHRVVLEHGIKEESLAVTLACEKSYQRLQETVEKLNLPKGE